MLFFSHFYLFNNIILHERGRIERLLARKVTHKVTKKKSNEEITSVVRELQHRFSIIDFTARDIDAALVETGADIEDNVQFVLAKKQRCYIVVTNNYKDYRFLPGIAVLRPEKIRKIPQ